MEYRGQKDYDHQRPERTGVLLVNLGTPEAPEPASLRRYLGEFLADPRVVEVPRLLWRLILHTIILRVRPRRSASAYRKVWTPQGSPLLLNTAAIGKALAQRLTLGDGERPVVAYAMRYGRPAIAQVLDLMQRENVTRLAVLPLYPQYSATTTASTFDAIALDFSKRRWLPDFTFISHYHDHFAYIEAMARHIERYWKEHGRGQKLLLSYHGIPLRYWKNGDPYPCQCHTTSRLLANRLGIGSDDYLTCFQSRFGREPWVEPYTDKTLEALPKTGIVDVDIFCPGFAADCLETLEEMAIQNRELFMHAGGKKYSYISALNDESVHLDALELIIRERTGIWRQPLPDTVALQQRAARASALSKDLFAGETKEP